VENRSHRKQLVLCHSPDAPYLLLHTVRWSDKLFFTNHNQNAGEDQLCCINFSCTVVSC